MNDGTLELKYEITETFDNIDMFSHGTQEIEYSILKKAFRMVLEKLCLMWFFLQDKSIFTDARRIYTVVGSMLNLTFKDSNPLIRYRSHRNGHYFSDLVNSDAIKYEIVLRPSVIEIQIKKYMSCPSRATKEVCAKEGSSALLTFIIEDFIYYNPIEVALRPLSNYTLHVDFYIYNVTHEDEGSYRFPYIYDSIWLQVSKLWFINQTYLKTIVGQEGETIEIICSSDPDQYITELTLKSNGTVKAIGDNQTVSFSFIPDRTDHRRKFQCVDSNHSSIMVEVELTIKRNCPDVEEIFLQKIGRMRGQKKKNEKYVLKSTLLYNDLDNTTGVPGYDILIESDELDIEDFQAYIITVTNRLGASDYHFEIIKKEDREIDQREKKYVFTICIVAAVLFVSIIIHIGLCVNRARTRVPIHSNMNEDRTYHTYDEIGTISHGSVSNVRPSETHDNQGQNLTQQHAATFSNTAYMQTTDNDSNALNADFPNDNLQQHGVTGVQEQHMSLSTNETNSIDDKEQSSDQKSQTSNDSDSESSQTVMVGNVGDGYENPYQTVLLDRPEGHQYTQITIERNTSIVSDDSDCEMQLLEHSLTKEAGYINLQF
ncbi:unnamed protein product [Mytilus edulis]|uniref:Uncharacterized protein n=1 Tax=Mytilus edulis TaxID=6550 RepID=A0A8S3QA06_MYTED|nr:unnamed protein product [Mytilus edulis]